jgi:RHS repeat-associated protein
MNERLVTWAYDEQGRANLSVKGYPARLAADPTTKQVLIPKRLAAGTGIEQVTLTWPSAGTTVLTNSVGQETIYKSRKVNGQYQLTQVVGAGCATCGPVNMRYGYDAQARLTEQTQLDTKQAPIQTSKIDYDSQGRVGKVSQIGYLRGKAQSAQMQVRYEYGNSSAKDNVNNSANIDQPTLIAAPSVVLGKERRVEIEYNDKGQPTRVTEKGFSPITVVNAIGKIGTTQEPQAIKRSISYRYTIINGRSVLSEVDGPLPNGPSNSPTDSDITRYERDAQGNHITVETTPGGIKRQYSYDQVGRVVTSILDDGYRQIRTQTAYDLSNFLSLNPRIISRAGVEISFTYDLAGRIVSVTRNDGARVNTTYDLAQSSIRHAFADGEHYETISDSERRALSSKWSDAQGKLLGAWEGISGKERAAPKLSKVSEKMYEPNGNSTAKNSFVAGALAGLFQIKLPNGAGYSEHLDDFKRVVQVEHPETGVNAVIYDQADRVVAKGTSLRDSLAKYDLLGRLTEVVYKDSSLVDQVQSKHELKKELPSVETVTMQYEGALLARQTSTSEDKQYFYDSNGRLVEEQVRLLKQSTDATAPTWIPILRTRFSRDTLGRINQVVFPEGAILFKQYGTDGNVKQIALQSPAANVWQSLVRKVSSDYGAKVLASNIVHSSSRGLLSFVHMNDMKFASKHDASLRLSSWTDGLLHIELDIGNSNQVERIRHKEFVSKVNTHPPIALENDQILDYDEFNRLRSANNAEQAVEYAYDLNGNRIQQRAGSTNSLHFFMVSRSDKLLEVRDTQQQVVSQYQYNSAGEPTVIRSKLNNRTIEYNTVGQISRVLQNGGVVARYSYNANRQRVAKFVANNAQDNVTFFTWHNGLVDAELDSFGKVKRRYLYLDQRLIALLDYSYQDRSDNAKVNSITMSAVHTDHLGTPRFISSEQSTVRWAATYEPFGRAKTQNAFEADQIVAERFTKTFWLNSASAGDPKAKSPDTFTFNLRFAGQYEDDETRWHYNWHRFYDPDNGRYLTPDPIGLNGGANAYSYADGNPASKTDPTGLYSISRNGITTFHTQFADLPTFRIPMLIGWEDYSNSDRFFHTYNKRVTASGLTGEQYRTLITYIQDHPTPSPDAFPADASGTYNPASPGPGWVRPEVTAAVAPDDVVSFLRTGLSGKTYVINVTTINHSLRFGIVIRGLRCENSTAIFDNYGEGAGFNQSRFNPTADEAINEVWYWATEIALESVTSRNWEIQGRDWSRLGSRSIFGPTIPRAR